jgi:hypothetical protein
MQKFILRERALTDNVLLIADEGKIFKGGYKAIVKENTFLNSWQDKEATKKFRKLEQAQKYIEKNYTPEEIENIYF